MTMGYLSLDADLDLRKVVISVWYRIPSSVRAALAENTEATCLANGVKTDNYVTSRTVPLVTMGSSLSSSTYELQTSNTGVNPSTDGTCPDCVDIEYTHYSDSSSGSVPTGPTFLGVHINNAAEEGLNDGRVVVSIQPDDQLSATNLQVGSFDPVCKSCFPPPGSTAGYEFSLVDQSFAVSYFDQFGGISTVGSTFDGWHNFVVSWDVTAGTEGRGGTGGGDCGPFVTTSSKMWFALDGINHDGSALPAVASKDADGNCGTSIWGANDITSSLVAYWAGVHDQGLGVPSFALATSSVPSSPIIIPGVLSSDQCDGSSVNPSNQKVEMADLQIFCGVTLDTSIESNRRLFISSAGKPVDPAIAQLALGKVPEVLLRGDDFITGHNRGTAGNFTVVGTVSVFPGSPGL
ncbi:hypothetical protein [Bradyrhizobium sp. USDA 4545]|uniref:hypothetical protein n=1 Tax=Bradyrhizobium sp. USDA 4545 TaxID=2817705 RepID=UPI0020A51CB7|nr:hypothetical protein [Bradyrhizobium sp. USDA 4545]MCP1832845.1 hypothetical protein [Bradyrhizobium sp. USDA 4545]